MRLRLRLPFLFLAGSSMLFAAACSDSTNTGPASDDYPVAAAVTGTCDLTGDLARDVRSWFPQPEQRDASDLARDIRTACNAGLQPAVTTAAWQILTMMEAVFEGGRAGDPGVGSSLANALLACTTSLCVAAALPGADLSGALAGAGLFAVRSGGTEPALANGVVAFTDEEGNANTALWGVSVDQPWSVVTSANPVLVYGNPAASGIPLQELNVGGLRYQLDVFPDNGEFVDGALHVGVCFESEFELPLVAGADPGARMQRNSVVLEDYQPTFCQPTVASASIVGPLLSYARRMLPSSVLNMFRGTRVGVIGGTPLDFSTFAPVAANTAGTLEFVSEPDPVVVAGQPIGVIEVRARSGNGTPMEKVEITLSILNNSGVPAGAVLAGDLVSITGERNGREGIAVFPDDGSAVTVGKAGGYTICASGRLNGFTFTGACSAVFNARNPN